ncbi:MAG: sensor domain-containing protein [Segniliparus sp.]|uniref:sensor domain-containing protein n=1 Tax=Segniliparus sp. TaxID=2804064 RepID=UPI003F3BE314
MDTRRWGIAGAALLLAGVLLGVCLNSGVAGVSGSSAGRSQASSAKKKAACSPDDPSEPAGSLLPGSPQAKRALVTADEASLVLGCRVNAAALPVHEASERPAVFEPARCAMLAGVGKPEDFSGALEPPVSVRYTSARHGTSAKRGSDEAQWAVVEHVGLFPDAKGAEAAFDAFRSLLVDCDLFQKTAKAPDGGADQTSLIHLAQVSTGPDWVKWSPSGSAGVDGRAYPLLVGHKGSVLYEFDVLSRAGRKKGDDPLDALVELSRRKIPG